MADEEKTDDAELAEGEASGSAKKGKLKMVGGIVGVIAAGAMAAIMAVPSTVEKPRFVGPFTVPLFEDQFNCNLIEREHYLQMKPEVMYQVYEETYLTTRMTDQLYLPQMKDAVLRIASNKSMKDLFGESDQNGFMEELSVALDPVLFPVHIGSSTLPWDPDEESGLRPGLSTDKTTFRGYFHDHVLRVDSTEMTMQVDDGPVTEFEEGDPDVKVIDADGSVLYIDVAGLKEGFSGDVQLGVRGRIMRIMPLDMIIQ